MSLSEAETRVQLIDPALRSANWREQNIEREYPYKKGRVRLVGEATHRDKPQYVDYVLRDRPRGVGLAVLEAKEENKSSGSGLQQAIAYAMDLGIRIALSSNGHGIVEQDLHTNSVRELSEFPTPEELRARLADFSSHFGEQVADRDGQPTPNPLRHPAFADPGGKRLRYYQERAVETAIHQMLLGRRRALLSLATAAGKTFIAANVAWKLWESGYAEKILFLTDRISLHSQAYNDFAVFGDARGIVKTENVPRHRDIHFGTYQTLYWGEPGEEVFRQYEPGFFDVVIVDECHRSGYGDWGAILEYFDQAFHLGMTATPKRSDSIDTYQFFASENCDESGDPQPAYQYSMGQGIEDGFLATYRVHRVVTDLDASGQLVVAEQLARGAELFVPDDSETRDVYAAGSWERDIMIGDRTSTLCGDLAEKMRNWGPEEKTVIFCASMEHAQQVRNEMQNLLGQQTGKPFYAARIVSEERDAQDLLEQFQASTAPEPVVVTTVDLLSTGVNIPALKNVVFMKYISSPTLFKQIIGRGSRIDERTGKEFFRIVDYTGATRLFDSWEVPPSVNEWDGPLEGSCEVAVSISDADTGDPIERANVLVMAGRKELTEAISDANGQCTITGLPEAPITLTVGAPEYRTRRRRLQTQSDTPESVAIELRRISETRQKVRISGVTVNIVEEIVQTLEFSSGQTLSVAEYKDFAGERVRDVAGDLVSLKELWRDPKTRASFRETLREGSVAPSVLRLALDRHDADDFDLLAHAGFDERIKTRDERARSLEQGDHEFLSQYAPDQQEVIRLLLDNYRIAGIDEITSSQVFRLEPFSRYGGVAGVSELFGGPDELSAMLRAVQWHLYRNGHPARGGAVA